MTVIIYTLENCPNCETLKNHLTYTDVSFEERDMQDPESLTDMRCDGFFGQEAPVLAVLIDDEMCYYHDEIFKNGKLDRYLVNSLCGGS